MSLGNLPEYMLMRVFQELIQKMGSLAQEESRSISTNTRWGIVHQYQEGKVVNIFKEIALKGFVGI